MVIDGFVLDIPDTKRIPARPQSPWPPRHPAATAGIKEYRGAIRYPGPGHRVRGDEPRRKGRDLLPDHHDHGPAGRDRRELAAAYQERWRSSPAWTRSRRISAASVYWRLNYVTIRQEIPRRVPRFRRCWLTCSCIMRSIRGWTGNSRAAHLSAMRMTLLRTATASASPAGCGLPSPRGSGPSALSCIPGRRRSCTARTRTAGETSSTPASISSATPSGAAWPRGKTGYFTGFSPAISGKAKKAKGKQIRDWHLNRRSGTDLSGLADQINPQVKGWIDYYGAFYRSELRFLAWRINEHLTRWAMHKFKRFRGKYAKAMAWLQKITSTSRAYSPTGSSSRSPEAGLWGPDDGRLSCPVLRAAGGETPPARPPCFLVQASRRHGHTEQGDLRGIAEVGTDAIDGGRQHGGIGVSAMRGGHPRRLSEHAARLQRPPACRVQRRLS